MGLFVSGIQTFDVQLGNTTIPVANNTFPLGYAFTLITVTACNTDSSGNHTISVYRNSGGSDDSTDQLIDSLTIDAQATVNLGLSGQALQSGASLDAVADTGGNVTISGTYAVLSPPA